MPTVLEPDVEALDKRLKAHGDQEDPFLAAQLTQEIEEVKGLMSGKPGEAMKQFGETEAKLLRERKRATRPNRWHGN